MHITKTIYVDYFETFHKNNDLLFSGVKDLILKVFQQYKRVPFTLYCVGSKADEPILGIFECIFDDKEKDKALYKLKDIAKLAFDEICFVCICISISIKLYKSSAVPAYSDFGILIYGEGKDYSKTELMGLMRDENYNKSSEINNYKKLLDIYNFGELVNV